MNSSSLFIVYLVVNSLFVVYLLRLSEGVLKPLLTYLLICILHKILGKVVPLFSKNEGKKFENKSKSISLYFTKILIQT